MNLKKLSLGLVALVGFGLMITMNAFTTKSEKKAYSYWQFNSNNITDVRTGSMYTKITNPEAPACAEGDDLPCVLRVEEGINTTTLLNTYLHDTSVFPNPNDITTAALSKKEGN